MEQRFLNPSAVARRLQVPPTTLRRAFEREDERDPRAEDESPP